MKLTNRRKKKVTDQLIRKKYINLYDTNYYEIISKKLQSYHFGILCVLINNRE